MPCVTFCFFFSSRRRHTRCSRDWSSDVCSSDLEESGGAEQADAEAVLDVKALEFYRMIADRPDVDAIDRKSTRLNSSHGYISYAVFCLKKKKEKTRAIAAQSNGQSSATQQTIEP